MPEKVIDNWSLVQVPWYNHNADEFTAPELTSGSRPAIQGQLRGDKEMIRKGLYLVTSRPVKVEKQNDQVLLHTESGSIYILGDVDKQYEKLFPNPVERLVAAFN